MAYHLTWVPGVLRAAGLKVVEQPGWQNRGLGDMAVVQGVMLHHTGGPRVGNMPSLGLIRDGRRGPNPLPGPLSQLALGRDGTFYMVAAGRSNHAGKGVWQGLTSGNSSFIGIEAENAGDGRDPWPGVQMDAYQRGVAAILAYIGADSSWAVGHKEWALPKGRKIDPAFDMVLFRAGVKALLERGAQRPRLEPQPVLRRGDEGEVVEYLQRKLGINADGDFGPATERAVKEFQSRNRLEPDGVVGPATWRVLEQ